MNLRWIEKDGQRVLQYQTEGQLQFWRDVETVQEPRLAREFTLCKNEIGWHATPTDIALGLVGYRGGYPTEVIKVREVLPDDNK